MSKRANNEGSIFPYKDGWAGYVWVLTPEGKKTRKWCYGKTREETHEKWLKLHEQARRGPVATKSPKLADYLAYWLREVVEPNLAPATAATYETFCRLYLGPILGKKQLEKLTVRDVQTWFNQLKTTCQCCAQGKDERRSKQKCCALGKCCKQIASERTIRDAWTILRAALNNAVREELLSRNVAALRRVAKPRRRKVKPWSVDEARQFLESARTRHDPLFAAYVLILATGLRRGEVLGLRWQDVDLDNAEMTIAWQLQRVRGQLHHRETKTEASDAVLPLIDVCVSALKGRREDQDRSREAAGEEWTETGLVFTTRTGRPVEPRNFNRSFAKAVAHAKVRSIPVHATRKTCASLLVALDVHPRIAMQILRHRLSGTPTTDHLGAGLPRRRRFPLAPVAVPSCCTGTKKAASDLQKRPLTWVEMRGFEPLTPSMRTKCATGLRYIPKDSIRLANFHGSSRHPSPPQSPTARRGGSAYWSNSTSGVRNSMISASACSAARASTRCRSRWRRRRTARASAARMRRSLSTRVAMRSTVRYAVRSTPAGATPHQGIT